jgi:hypothetical protein
MRVSCVSGNSLIGIGGGVPARFIASSLRGPTPRIRRITSSLTRHVCPLEGLQWLARLSLTLRLDSLTIRSADCSLAPDSRASLSGILTPSDSLCGRKSESNRPSRDPSAWRAVDGSLATDTCSCVSPGSRGVGLSCGALRPLPYLNLLAYVFLPAASRSFAMTDLGRWTVLRC